jgi:ABC-type hemin transport system substrate-binding protein
MNKLEAIEADILVTKEKLAKAEAAGNEALMIMYGNNLTMYGNNLTAVVNNLTELLKQKNLMSTGTGN